MSENSVVKNENPRRPSFTWEVLQNDWLLNWPKSLPYSNEEILCLMNLVRDVFGEQWIQQRTGGARGVLMVLHLAELGRLIFRLRQGLPQTNNLLAKLLSQGRDSASVEAEAQIVANLLEHDCIIEIEPEILDSQGKSKKPDIRFLSGDSWIYVEVTRPEVPKHMNSTMGWLKTIFDNLNDRIQSGSTQAFVMWEPTKEEIQDLGDIAMELVSTGGVGWRKVDDIGYVAHAQTREDLERIRESRRTHRHTLRILAQEPAKYIGVETPYSDQRTERIINAERRQFARDEKNLLVINCANLQGDIADWENHCRYLLEQEMNRAISAILLYSRIVIGGTIETKSILIKNGNADTTIDENSLAVLL